MSESLADRAVTTLAAVKSLGDQLPDDHPMRHSVREMKYLAQSILSSSIDEAQRLVFAASRIVNDYDKAQAEKGGAA